MINPWVRPLRGVLEPLASEHHAALHTGVNQPCVAGDWKNDGDGAERRRPW
jgi:hypothetical protein